ncbi:MAG TPA: VWA domain-containing protein, partial [Chitinophagaceae bacterium]|nr:VWA domain-containing protein [Chitinophagaceae bacterium]
LYDFFNDIEFAQPYQFILLGLVPILVLWYISSYRKKQASIMVSTTSMFATFSSWKTSLRHLPFALRMLALVCLVVALARPQKRNDEQNITGEGVDIILCMDVSGSMLAQDLMPSRFDAAKSVAANFVDSRPTDRIGLVIFSGESFTLTPLTTDKNVLKTQIYNIRQGLLEDGTAIGSGLATSVDRLRSSTAKSKVVILLTDGENNGGLIDPNTAKEIAKSIGVRVYTIGVGTEGYAPVPMQTIGGIVMQREKVNIDEKLLKQIADETGGKYFRAKDNEGLINIYSEIDKLEKSRIEVTTTRRYTEKFFPFALAAAILIFLELFLRLTTFRKFP